jgi:hypothetical protein
LLRLYSSHVGALTLRRKIVSSTSLRFVSHQPARFIDNMIAHRDVPLSCFPAKVLLTVGTHNLMSVVERALDVTSG